MWFRLENILIDFFGLSIGKDITFINSPIASPAASPRFCERNHNKDKILIRHLVSE